MNGYIVSILTHFFFVNVGVYNSSLGDGGNNIASLLLVYLIFVKSDRALDEQTKSTVNKLKTSLSNAFFLVAKIQICIVYLTAGLEKAKGNAWQNGTALFKILQLPEFSKSGLGEIIVKNPLLFTVGSYLTVIFQIAFPFLIWNKKARIPLIIFGLILHFQIFYVMGLFHFGLIMMLVYSAFLGERSSTKISKWVVPSSKLVVGFDEECLLCQKFKRIVLKLDWLTLISPDGARRPKSVHLSNCDFKGRISEIHAYDTETGQLMRGFEAIAGIILRLPLLRPFFPVIMVVSFTNLGNFLYTKVARSDRRKICTEGACSLSCNKEER